MAIYHDDHGLPKRHIWFPTGEASGPCHQTRGLGALPKRVLNMSSNQSTEVYDFMRWCLYGKRHQFFSADFFPSCIQTNDNHSSKKSCFCPEIHFFLSSSRKRFINHWILKMNNVHPFFLSIFFHSLFSSTSPSVIFFSISHFLFLSTLSS